jgi:hypothetical protein
MKLITFSQRSTLLLLTALVLSGAANASTTESPQEDSEQLAQIDQIRKAAAEKFKSKQQAQWQTQEAPEQLQESVADELSLALAKKLSLEEAPAQISHSAQLAKKSHKKKVYLYSLPDVPVWTIEKQSIRLWKACILQALTESNAFDSANQADFGPFIKTIKKICTLSRINKQFYTLIHDLRWIDALFNEIITSPELISKFGSVQKLFMLMVEIGWTDAANVLLHKGVNENQRIKANYYQHNRNPSPLFLAAQGGHLGIVKLLTARGAPINPTDNSPTPLLIAVYNGHLEVVRFLVEQGAALNSKDNDVDDGIVDKLNRGLTALGFDDPIPVNVDGINPLYVAAHRGHHEITQYLLDKGALINAFEKHPHWTALIIAAYCGRLNIVQLLVEHGADFHAFAYEIANNHKHTAVAEYLKQVMESEESCLIQ